MKKWPQTLEGFLSDIDEIKPLRCISNAFSWSVNPKILRITKSSSEKKKKCLLGKLTSQFGDSINIKNKCQNVWLGCLFLKNLKQTYNHKQLVTNIQE